MFRPRLAALALCAAALAATTAAAQPLDGDPAGGAPALTGSAAIAPDAALVAPSLVAPERSVAPERETRATVTQTDRDSGPTRACTARVIGLRPLSHYDHAQGSGFLAVREGPGSTFPQLGELYLGDTVTIGDRRGNWYAVRCSGGLCLAPLWGEPAPQGWAYGRFLHLSCPD